MADSPKNPDRDNRHARRRDEDDSDLDGREAASLLYGGPDHSDNSTDTDSDTNDDSTDAPPE
jgi:hypothetical protein